MRLKGGLSARKSRTVFDPPAPSSITPSIVVNRGVRVSGVAPFSVHFDATGTTSTNTADTFRELWYLWNFGEASGPGVANWTVGANAGRSRNLAFGPIAAHLYEVPGDYTAQLIVIDTVTGDTAVETVAITAQDPDVVYAGKTMWYANTEAALPGGVADATHIVTSSWDAIAAATTGHINSRGDGWRHRLNGGDTFLASSVSSETVNNLRPSYITIESYGTGDAIISRSGAGIDSTSTTIIFGYRRSQNQLGNIVKDLTIDCEPSAAGSRGAAVGQYAGNDLTIVRVTARKCQMLYINSSQPEGYNNNADVLDHGHGSYDGLAIWDSTHTEVEPAASGIIPYGIFLGAFYGTVQGCTFDSDADATTPRQKSHCMRLWHAYKMVVANNKLRGSGVGAHCLKMHSRTAAQIVTAGRDPAIEPWGTGGDSGGKTSHVWFASNHIEATHTATPIAMGSPSGGELDDVGSLIEKVGFVGNYIDAGPNSKVNQGFGYWGGAGSLIALNIFNMRTMGGTSLCLHLGKRSECFGTDGSLMQIANDVKVWGNTGYMPKADSSACMMFNVSNLSADIELRNNAFWAPNDSGAALASGVNSAADQATTGVAITATGYSASNNSTDAQVRQATSPYLNVTSTPAQYAIDDFEPAVGSILLDAGAPVTLPRDIRGAPVPYTGRDIGAVQAA